MIFLRQIILDDSGDSNEIPESMDNELKKMLSQRKPDIKIIGVGGAGINTVSRFIERNIETVTTVVVDTDAADLLKAKAHKKVLLGRDICKGKGCGGDAEIAYKIARDDAVIFKEILSGSDMVFITGGLGRGVGTGVMPVISRIAKEMGILTVCVVTSPFEVEGIRQISVAKDGLNNLLKACDTLIFIPNDKLLEIVPDVPLDTAFKVADEILVNTVEGIVELIVKPGEVNLDFADVTTVMKEGGLTLVGLGESDTDNRAQDAIEKAINNPLLDLDISGGKAALINVVAGKTLTLEESNIIVSTVARRLDPGAPVIWGTQISDEYKNTVKVLVIVTGISSSEFIDKTYGAIPDSQIRYLKPKNLSTGTDSGEQVIDKQEEGINKEVGKTRREGQQQEIKKEKLSVDMAQKESQGVLYNNKGEDRASARDGGVSEQQQAEREKNEKKTVSKSEDVKINKDTVKKGVEEPVSTQVVEVIDENIAEIAQQNNRDISEEQSKDEKKYEGKALLHRFLSIIRKR